MAAMFTDSHSHSWGGTVVDPLLDREVWGGSVDRSDPDWRGGLLYEVQDRPGNSPEPRDEEVGSWRSYRVDGPTPPTLSPLLLRTGLQVPAIRRDCALGLAGWRGYMRSLLVSAITPTTPEDDASVSEADPLRVEPELPPPPIEEAFLVAVQAPNAPSASLAGALTGLAA